MSYIIIWGCKFLNDEYTPLQNYFYINKFIVTSLTMYSVEIVMDAYVTYNKVKSTNKTSKLMQAKHSCKLTRQTISTWNKKLSNNVKSFIQKRLNGQLANRIEKDKLIKNTSNCELLLLIKEIVYRYPQITREKLKKSIRDTLNINVNDRMLSLYFKRLNFTRKQPRHYLVKDVTYLDALIIKRNTFKDEISKRNVYKILSIDESNKNKSKICFYLFGHVSKKAG